MTCAEIAAASNQQLIERLAEIDEQTLTAYAHRRPACPQLRKEHARIWQQFAVRRRTGKLRMTPRQIRSKVFAAQLKLAR